MQFLGSARYCITGYILLSLVLWAFAGYAHRVNSKRAVDDPEKKEFHPAAVYLVPFTWFFILLAYVFILVARAILFGVFLVLFTIALVAFRKPFILNWLKKFATKIGNKLLEANTILAWMLFPRQNPQNG
jgi:hypothetical protein